jgi:gluconolactonase
MLLVVLAGGITSNCADSPRPGRDAGSPAGAADNRAMPGRGDGAPRQAGPGFDPLAGIGAVDPVAQTFMFTEGPTWRAAEGVLLVSDIPANMIYRLTPPAQIDVFRADSGNANGLTSDQDGRLLAAEHGNRRVSRTGAAGVVQTVVDSYAGSRLNSPNDLAVRADGVIYFTDRPYGIMSGQQELAFNGVFRITSDGALTAEWEGELASRPNGIALAPDQSQLYVADTTADVSVFQVQADGTLTDRRSFADDVTGADGMAVDNGGNLFVTALDGIHVYAPDGTA